MHIPTELILKEDPLKNSEKEIYNSHTVMGSKIIRLNSSEKCRFFVKVCSDMCLHHHERYDGKGFPYGLRGEENSIYNQLCGLVAKFDTLFIKRMDVNMNQFDFVINEIKVDRGAFSSEIIDLISKCCRKIMRFYKSIKVEEAVLV